MTEELKLWPTPYGPITQRMIFANLLKDVIRPGKCVFCGSCAAVCPTQAVQMLEDVPRILGVCIKCGYCYYACPQTTEDGFEGFGEHLDERIFGLKRSEKFGVYRKIYVIEKLDDPDSFPDESIAKKILAYGLKKGYWDVVAYAGRDDPVTDGLLNYPISGWRGRPSIAFNPNDIESAKFKLLTPGPTILAVRGAVEEFKGSTIHGGETIRVAVFGPPQHIRSIWRGRFSWAGHTKLLKTIVFTITHFERDYYIPSKLKLIISKKGLSLDNIKDVRYGGSTIIFRTMDGNNIEIQIDELEEALHPGFSKVHDFTGEYSDLSIGTIEGVEGIVLIARSEEAVKIIDEVIEYGTLKKLDFNESELIGLLNKLYEGGSL